MQTVNEQLYGKETRALAQEIQPEISEDSLKVYVPEEPQDGSN